MEQFSIDRRSVLGVLAGAGATAALPTATAAAETARETDPATRATFEAVVDAVVPRTPGLAAELGEEHVPGGLEVGLEAYLIEFVNTLFAAGNGTLDGSEELRLSEAAARACDAAAAELLARGGNESDPDPTRFEAGGPFAWLARKDRLRALALLDEREFDTADVAEATGLSEAAVEGSGGLFPQLVVAFTQVIYYSEWAGYDDITAAPSDREFSGDVQSWEQVGFPGVIDGSASFRGYWGGPGSSLAAGRLWKTVDVGDGPPAQIRFEPGEFREDDYDTADYEEPFDTSGRPADDGAGFADGSNLKRPDDAVAAARERLDDGLAERFHEAFFGGGGR